MSAEWLMSISGTHEQKEKLFVVCMTCHDLAPILKSTYNATDWQTTLLRMWNWSQASSFNKPILSPNRENARPGDEEFAKYLSTINMSARSTIDFPAPDAIPASWQRHQGHHYGIRSSANGRPAARRGGEPGRTRVVLRLCGGNHRPAGPAHRRNKRVAEPKRQGRLPGRLPESWQSTGTATPGEQGTSLTASPNSTGKPSSFRTGACPKM